MERPDLCPAKPIWRAVAWSDRAARPARARFIFFFYFLFSNFFSLTIFLAHKLCVQLVFMEKDMHTTRRFAKKIMHITCR
jgi:hypothetical protein